MNSLTHYMSTSKIMGQAPGLIENDDNLYAVNTANPTNPWYWILGVNDPAGGGTNAYRVTVELRFYAKLFDPQPFASS